MSTPNAVLVTGASSGMEVVADAVYRALTARTPRRRYPVGPKSRLLPLLFTRLPASAADALRMRIFHVYRRFGAANDPGARPIGPLRVERSEG